VSGAGGRELVPSHPDARAPARPRLLVLIAFLPVVAAAAEERPFGGRELRVFVAAGQSFHPEGQGFAEFGSPVVQWGRFLSRRLEVLAEVQPLFVVNQPKFPPDGERETVEALAVDIGLRWYVTPTAWRPKLYLEILDGPLYALRRVPARGSTFNFLTQMGGGVRLPLGERWHPFVSYRWVHISNAGTGTHNPDWDFHGLLVGGSLVLQ
jgi:hypothetical protein